MDTARTHQVTPIKNPILMSPALADDFRQYLMQELVRRSRVNPKYSLRAFARSLEIEPSFLSKLLSQKRSMTSSTVKRLAPRLALSPEQVERFSARARRANPRFTDMAMGLEPHQLSIEISTDAAKIEEAQLRIKNFHQELCEFLKTTSQADRVYQVAVTLYPIRRT